MEFLKLLGFCKHQAKHILKKMYLDKSYLFESEYLNEKFYDNRKNIIKSKKIILKDNLTHECFFQNILKNNIREIGIFNKKLRCPCGNYYVKVLEFVKFDFEKYEILTNQSDKIKYYDCVFFMKY